MSNKYLPLIQRGGSYFDIKHDMCKRYNLDNCLPDVFCYYLSNLFFDVRQQIHYRVSSERDMKNFIEKELKTRKIMSWAQGHLPNDMKQKKDVRALLEYDIDTIIEIVKKEEKQLRKHYFMTRILKLFQKVEGVIR